MKKETIATAGIFLVVGFLAGYITDAQLNWNARRKATPAGGAMPSGLPEGHPPVDSAALIKQMEDMAAQNPKDPEVRLKLANFLYDQKQYSQSIGWYQRALEIEPKNVNAHTDLGTAYFYIGRPQDALEQYRQSLEMDPKHEPTLLNSIVVNLEGTHDFAAAQRAWDRLHKLNPNQPALASLKEKLDAARTGGAAMPR
jgi:tetratricopeptide (TPR) repeat protein